ncbi:hypothetical protein D3X11_04565 [Streptococcus sp. X16XC17]|uniref:Spy0128 family protein n=1 Tax=Streptococcus sp. X16XC17 TaxID=2316646 RepID=UPI00103D04F7|nr:FctA domain-containing protein [Streptococcus sp. X16XC17]TCD46651.1 hypothetical protein D3X11_04565 [Streptococcus sp. X16XC17]
MMKNKFQCYECIFKCSLIAGLSFLLLIGSPRIDANQIIDNPLTIQQIIAINTGYAKPKDTFSYRIEAVSAKAPLPNGAKSNYTFTLAGDQKKEIVIAFSSPGDYVYKVYQEERSDVQHVTQDKIVYTVTMRVVETKGDLHVYSYLIMDNEGYQHNDLTFKNTYIIRQGPLHSLLFKAGYTSTIYGKLGMIFLAGFWVLIFFMKKRQKDEEV